MNDMEAVRQMGDGAALAVAIGVILGMVPVLVGMATLVYTCIRIYETKTVQDMLARWRNK